jgi:hypothetical protein
LIILHNLSGFGIALYYSPLYASTASEIIVWLCSGEILNQLPYSIGEITVSFENYPGGIKCL